MCVCIYVYIRVCVCVCERERDREREICKSQNTESIQFPLKESHLNIPVRVLSHCPKGFTVGLKQPEREPLSSPFRMPID